MISVMLVDDSAAVRGLLGRIIDGEPDMEVVGSAPNGAAALAMMRTQAPDIVILDIEMPEMDGLTALPRILAMHPRTHVIMASSHTTRGARVTMEALALGAADYIAKPTALSAVRGMESIAHELVAKVRALGTATASPPPPPPTRPRIQFPAPVAEDRAVPPRVVVIASSTGGPNALSTVLAKLPRDFPLPILIAQHMPPLFTASLADRLSRESGLQCAEAHHGDIVEPGRVYIAPGDRHMTVGGPMGLPTLLLDDDPPINFCRPSADRLLRSAAQAYGPAVLALVLTGMGVDGLRGCESVVLAGGRVLAQDRDSSVVWGMPGSVVNAGLASAVVPLHRIGHQLASLCAIGV